MHQRQVEGNFCEKTLGGLWSQSEHPLHLNILKLRATKFAIPAFSIYKNHLAVHVQMYNQAALAYLVKMRETRNLIIIQEAKEPWKFCLENQIASTAEYLPKIKNLSSE